MNSSFGQEGWSPSRGKGDSWSVFLVRVFAGSGLVSGVGGKSGEA